VTDLTRRRLLMGGAATAALAVTGGSSGAVSLPLAAALPAAPPRLAYTFELGYGDDCCDVVWAETEQAAWEQVIDARSIELAPNCPWRTRPVDRTYKSKRASATSAECLDSTCECHEGLPGMERVRAFDGYENPESANGIPLQAMKKAGWGVQCQSCSDAGAYESGEYTNEWEIVDGVPYCHDCMHELELWESVDPKYAEELRMDKLLDEKFARERIARDEIEAATKRAEWNAAHKKIWTRPL
jgi:hypothetical protein